MEQMMKPTILLTSTMIAVGFAGLAVAQSTGSAQGLNVAQTSDLCVSAEQGECKHPGLVFLYKLSQETTLFSTVLEASTETCLLWRQGGVAGSFGSFRMEDAERFAIVLCPLGEENETEGAVDQIFNAVSDLDLDAYVGTVHVGTSGHQTDWDSLNSRPHIIKISHFNGQASSQRNADLARINEEALTRKNAWSIDATMKIDLASGTNAPDAIDLISYDSKQAADLFRDENPDILQMVGTFNKKFLSDFTYLSGTHDKP